MQGRKPSRRIAIPTILCLLTLVAMATGALYLKSTTALAAPAHVGLQDGFVPHTIKVKPITKKLGIVRSAEIKTPTRSGGNKVLFPCQSDTNPLPILCYGPGQIAQAYGVQDLFQRNVTGTGSTIVIIDAYGSPTIQADLQAFDAAWGLPAPAFKVLTPNTTSGADPSWALETTLDVEWSHAMAPGAAITLVVAASNSDVDLYKAISYAVDHNLGDVISISFGENESCVDPNLLIAEHQVFQEAASKSISVLAAAGDSGSAQFTCDGSSLATAIAFPASDPLVTALGGTALTANATTGQYIGETAWNESSIFNTASGGGFSVRYQRPDYQSGVTGETMGRAIPDMALNASVNGGVLIYQSDPASGQEYTSIVGGTSLAAPEFAGIIADGVQLAHHRLGFLNKSLYDIGRSPFSASAFNDITSGSNILFSTGVAGYTVQRGWDAVTGWGSPKAVDFLPLLIRNTHSNDANGL